MTPPDPNALAAATTLATALSDPATAWATIPAGGGRAWPQSLAGGAAGIALLHITRARTGHGDWRTARTWLSAAARDALTAAANAGLYVGVPALAFVTHTAATPGRHARTPARLADATIAITRRRLTAAHARIDRGERPEPKEFDLIRGLAGLGAYHLERHPDHPITRDVLAYLLRLTEPLPTDPALAPWWTDLAPTGEPHPDFPHGHANIGVAHGIGAVLALLSLAVLQDIPVPGMPEAIERICGWTDQWRNDTDGPWWPGFVTPDQSARPRPSWCYGIAGTARAQQLAGMALGDTTRQRLAETAILTALGAPAHLNLLGPEIGLCHGTAGLLQATWRMAADAPGLTSELPRLTARLLDRLDGPITDPELLDGAAGAALALHTVGTGTCPTPAWDRFLLLA
ncbi:lantibiotic modifying enzyme [Actinomadura craniellae]|uniref:Lantibiotic modifying enzyme n=1 Tax=Actinomadura craniellae TaxID=2231787 RepID=A0A365H7I0_9ACTN|nr:lanthionine synthetase C family protein [Actinomadura craniellae]RAY14999.1 lantibiotic modifying enzyme [Actinomadura craniellae]